MATTDSRIERHNYKSDFNFLLTIRDREGNALGVPPYDWAVDIYSEGWPSRRYSAGSKGGELYNCRAEGEGIRVVCDGHGLGVGRLMAEARTNAPHALYADGHELTCTPMALGIELVSGAGDEGMEADVSLMLPMAVLTAYDMAVAAGYAGSKEEYTAALGLVPTAGQAITDANAAADAATAAAGQALQAASDAEQHAAEAVVDMSKAVSEALSGLEGAADAANAAAQAANDGANNAAAAIVGANEAANAANSAAATANGAATTANNAAEQVRQQLTHMDDYARKDAANTFAASQTITGTLTVTGDIVQQGASYESHAEQLYTAKDMIITREGAVGGLGAEEATGIRATRYNGDDDGLLVFNADGEARVGDEGDTQPLLTRAEAADLPDGALLRWNAATLRAEPLPMRMVDMEVTYEDDTTETFIVICKDGNN